MLTRKIGQLLRGKTTPFQVFTAALLGTAIGFLPGFGRAPGLTVALVAVLLVLNANLFVAAFCAALGKLAGLALLPTSFKIGQVLIDEQATDLFAKMVNTPVLRFFGFEHYAVTGGLVLGLALGAVLGLLLAFLQGRVRKLMAGLAEDSERYGELTSKKWVSVLCWLFVGPREGSWEELGDKRVGLPFRPLGLVALLVLVGGAFAANALLSSGLVGSAVRKGLERANGATVELEGFQLAPRSGRLAIERLAMADRYELSSDLFRGLAFEADVSVSELFRGRVVVERLSIREAASGVSRDTPGEPVGPAPPESEDAEEGGGFGLPKLDELDLEDVLADVERWKGTLEKVQRLLGRLAGDASEQEPEPEPGTPSWRERLEQRAERSGLADLTATHLFPSEPRFLVRELVVEDFRFGQIGEEQLDLRVMNLSSSPAKLGKPVQLALATVDDSVRLDAALGATPTLALRATGLDVDRIASGLEMDGQRLVRGGTIEFEMDGSFDARAGTLDLPLRVRLDGTELNVPRVGATLVEDFSLPVGLRGPLGSPRVSVDDEQLVSALVAAGKKAFASRVQDEVNLRVDAAKAELRAELTARYGDQLDGLGIDLDSIQDLDDLDQLASEHLGAPLAAIRSGALVQDLTGELQSEVSEAVDEVKTEATEAITEGAGELLGETLKGLAEGDLSGLEDMGEGKLEGLEKLGEKLGDGLGGDLGQQADKAKEKLEEKLGGKLGGLFGKPKGEKP